MNHLPYLDFYATVAMFGIGILLLFFLIWARGALRKIAARKALIAKRVQKRHHSPGNNVWGETLSRRRDLR